MIADIVATWQDAGIIAASISALIAAGYAIRRAAKSLRASIEQAWSAAVDASETGHLVRYHLGPNGTTRPIHERLRLLEEAHQIEQQETP